MSPPASPFPIKAKAGADRELFCVHADDCVDAAARSEWPGFACTSCPIRGRATPGRTELLAQHGGRAQETAALPDQRPDKPRAGGRLREKAAREWLERGLLEEQAQKRRATRARVREENREIRAAAFWAPASGVEPPAAAEPAPPPARPARELRGGAADPSRPVVHEERELAAPLPVITAPPVQARPSQERSMSSPVAENPLTRIRQLTANVRELEAQLTKNREELGQAVATAQAELREATDAAGLQHVPTPPAPEAAAPPPALAVTPPPTGTLRAKVLAALANGEAVRPTALAEAIEEDPTAVSNCLGLLARVGEIKRPSRGVYQLASRRRSA